MAIRDYLKTKAGALVARLWWIGTGGDPLGLGGIGTAESGQHVTETRLMGLSTGWACVNLHAGLMGTLPVGVYQRNADGSRGQVEGHWLSDLVKRSPNADQTAVDFWEFLQMSLELRGNAYARRIYSGDRLIAIEPIAPDLVGVKRRQDGVLEYTVAQSMGRQVTLTERDIWHVRGPGGDPLGGLSTLAFGRHVFGSAISADKSAAGLFRNGMQSSGAFKFDDWLKPDQREIARENMAREQMGAHNAGRPVVLEGGVDWVPFSFKPDEAQLLETRSFGVEEVCRFFQVPPVLISHTDKVSSWGTGISEISNGFVKYALARRVRRIEQSIAKFILQPRDIARGIYVEFSMEGLLRGAPKERAEFYRSMTQIAAMTVNEVRKLENLPPVDGGDLPRLQSQNIPLGLAVGTQPITPTLLPPPGE